MTRTRHRVPSWPVVAVTVIALLVAACQPTVKLQAPDKPITINVNVKIKIEREAEKVIQEKEELF